MHSTGLGHAWIREEMERVEDFCYTYKTKFQKKKKKKKVRMCIREWENAIITKLQIKLGIN